MRGRLSPEAMYPAGEAGIVVRQVSLPNGNTLRLLECGPTGGEPIVLIHGWAACVYTFRFTIGALAAAGRRVLAFDLRGHGLSSKPGDPHQYTTPAMLDDLSQLLAACEIDGADVVGHSLGGGLALRFALLYPARVRRLVLAAPVGLTRVGLQRIARLVTPGVTTRAARFLPPRWLTAFLVRSAYGDPRRVTARVIDEYWAPSQFPNYYRAVRALLHVFDWEPLSALDLGRVRVPTLVMLGSADRLIRGADQHARHIPGASIVTLDGGGHLGIEECPAEFNATVSRFLNR